MQVFIRLMISGCLYVCACVRAYMCVGQVCDRETVCKCVCVCRTSVCVHV